MKKHLISLKERFLKNNFKMNCLTTYIILNLLYIFVASFLMTVNVIKYRHMAKGYIVFLVINIIIGIVIAVKKKTKKDKIYLLVLALLVFRNYINNICSKA